MRYMWWILGLIVLAGLIWWAVGAFQAEEAEPSGSTSESTTQSLPPADDEPTEADEPVEESTRAENSDVAFDVATKAPHFVASTPAHASTLTQLPEFVEIEADFTLSEPSAIRLTYGDTDYGLGETEIALDGLSMRRELSPSAPTGFYTVTYDACWPDRSCHDGQFQFFVE